MDLKWSKCSSFAIFIIVSPEISIEINPDVVHHSFSRNLEISIGYHWLPLVHHGFSRPGGFPTSRSLGKTMGHRWICWGHHGWIYWLRGGQGGYRWRQPWWKVGFIMIYILYIYIIYIIVYIYHIYNLVCVFKVEMFFLGCVFLVSLCCTWRSPVTPMTALLWLSWVFVVRPAVGSFSFSDLKCRQSNLPRRQRGPSRAHVTRCWCVLGGLCSDFSWWWFFGWDLQKVISVVNISGYHLVI